MFPWIQQNHDDTSSSGGNWCVLPHFTPLQVNPLCPPFCSVCHSRGGGNPGGYTRLSNGPVSTPYVPHSWGIKKGITEGHPQTPGSVPLHQVNPLCTPRGRERGIRPARRKHHCRAGREGRNPPPASLSRPRCVACAKQKCSVIPAEAGIQEGTQSCLMALFQPPLHAPTVIASHSLALR